MSQEFSHYEARAGTRVVASSHASTLRRLFGYALPIFVLKADKPRHASSGKQALFHRRGVQAA